MVSIAEVTTARLVLEPLVSAHASEMFAVLSDASRYEFIDDTPPVSIDALARRYAGLETRVSPDATERWLNWVVRERASRHCIGYVQATVRADDIATIAYVMAADSCGRGLSREAVSAMIATIARELDVSVFEASIDARNVKSVALVTGLGFQLARTLPGASIVRGQRSDETIYALRTTGRERSTGAR